MRNKRPRVVRPSEFKRMAVLLPLQFHRGREILRGILGYLDTIHGWDIRTGLNDGHPYAVAEDWQPHGVIAEASNLANIARLQKLGVPVVNTSTRFADQPFPQVRADNHAEGRLAAEYFLGKGYHRFGVLTDTGSATSNRREAGFRERLAEAGYSPATHNIAERQGVFEGWSRADDVLSQWLKSLPKPVAILTDDYRGPVLSQICTHIGVAVPEQVAMLGIDNDELQCRQAHPPLSSIQVAHAEIGFQAAKLLDSLLAGGKPYQPLLVKPIGVITRASTDILAIEDPDVADAVRFISQNAHQRVNVADLVDALAVSRRVLEYRFRRVLGRSLLEEIQRVRVERARTLLANTNMALPRIAKDAGFRDSHHLWTVFRKHTGTSPAAYRRSQKA